MGWIDAAVTAFLVMVAGGAGAFVVYARLEAKAAASSGERGPKNAVAALQEAAGHAVAGTSNKDRASEGWIDPLIYDQHKSSTTPLARRAFFARAFKRGTDIVLALLLAVFTAPMVLVAAIAVKLDSPGPVFYRQTRVGRDGKVFRIWKFRTMRTDAEAQGAKWASKGDSRITRVGNFLRRSRIDEIPQALNILRGEMSFVGPRPERPEFTGELAEKIPNFDARTLVKPGLTGWAQVNLPYAASVNDTRMKLAYDLYYIEKHSPALDLLIVLMTFRVALFSDSAH